MNKKQEIGIIIISVIGTIISLTTMFDSIDEFVTIVLSISLFMVIYLFFFVLIKKVTGTIVGVLVLVAGIYAVFSYPTIVLETLKTWKLMSIIGLWLTGAGVLGEQKLSNWEAKLEKNLNDVYPETLSAKLTNQWGKPILWLINIVILLKIISTVNHTWWEGNHFWISLFVISIGWGAIAVIVTFITATFLGPIAQYILAVPIFLFLLPYRIVGAFSNEEKLERAMILSGLVLGTIGLVFNT